MIRKLSSLLLLIPLIAVAGDPIEVDLGDPWNADPVTDASEVAESDSPYLLQLHVLGPASIPPYTTIDEASCWTKSIEVRLLNGFSDVGGFEPQRQNAVLRLYAHYFNGHLMQRLKELGKSDCAL